MTVNSSSGERTSDSLKAILRQPIYQQASESSTRDQCDAGTAEQVDRFVGITGQEFDGEQVQHNLEGAFQPVIGFAVFAGMVMHFHFGNARPDRIGVHRNEAVHFAVQAETGDDFALVGFQGAAVIMQGDAGHGADHPVGQVGGQGAGDEVILAVFAPAADHVIAFIDFFDHGRNVARVVLQVGVAQHDQLADRNGQCPAAMAAV